MRDPINWRQKGLVLLGMLFLAVILNAIFPATYAVEGLSILDMMMLLVVMGVVIILGTYRYFYWNSPTVFTETDKVSTNTNMVVPVIPEDPRIPPQLLMPFGGYNVQRVYLGKEDMGDGGGALFAPFYAVELLGQHLIVHGKPVVLTAPAIEANAWMFDALTEYPDYVHGKTEVWTVIWGEGPPLDMVQESLADFKRDEVRGAQQELVQETEVITGKTYVDISKKFRTIEEAREKPEAEKVVLAQRELKEKKGDEND